MDLRFIIRYIHEPTLFLYLVDENTLTFTTIVGNAKVFTDINDAKTTQAYVDQKCDIETEVMRI